MIKNFGLPDETIEGEKLVGIIMQIKNKDRKGFKKEVRKLTVLQIVEMIQINEQWVKYSELLSELLKALK